MPEDLNSNLDMLAKEIKDLKGGRINKIEKEPIAFGLVALKPSFIVDDYSGVDRLESSIRGIKGVGNVNVIEVTLI